MGEPVVVSRVVDKKIDEQVKSGGGLEVSVSFGRFDSDALSWEKWSSFSPNKYLEEVGSLSTPGSVAQKKAYFEAHYKKIAAAKKAEESQLDNTITIVAPVPDELCCNYQIRTPAVDGLSNEGIFVAENSQIGNAAVLQNITITDAAKYDISKSGEATLNGLMSVISLEQEDTSVALKYGDTMTEETKDDLDASTIDSEVTIGINLIQTGKEIVQTDSHKIVEKAPEKKSRKEHSFVLEMENCKVKAHSMSQKVITITKKDGDFVRTEKGIVSLATKPSQASNPKFSKPSQASNSKFSKPKSIPAPLPAPESAKKKVNRSPLPKNKNLLVGEIKRVNPALLHMSMCLGHAHSSIEGIPLTRKSLIMDSMGDKDIVKRAFKSFQNRSYGSSTHEKLSTVKQAPITPLKSKVSTSPAPRKGNEGLRKDVENIATRRSHSGTSSKPPPSRSDRGPAERNAHAASPSVNLRSDERAEKRKEFLKNLEAKSIARKTEYMQQRTKSKEEKEAEMKKSRQSLNFKATPLYRGQGKRHPEKENPQQ